MLGAQFHLFLLPCGFVRGLVLPVWGLMTGSCWLLGYAYFESLHCRLILTLLSDSLPSLYHSHLHSLLQWWNSARRLLSRGPGSSPICYQTELDRAAICHLLPRDRQGCCGFPYHPLTQPRICLAPMEPLCGQYLDRNQHLPYDLAHFHPMQEPGSTVG